MERKDSYFWTVNVQGHITLALKEKEEKLDTLLSTSTKPLVFLDTACTWVFMCPQGSRARAHGQEAERRHGLLVRFQIIGAVQEKTELLAWPKSSLKFLCNIFWKNPNGTFWLTQYFREE